MIVPIFNSERSSKSWLSISGSQPDGWDKSAACVQCGTNVTNGEPDAASLVGR